MQRLFLPRLAPSLTDKNVVTLVKTEEKMLPEIVDLKNDDIKKEENDHKVTFSLFISLKKKLCFH